MPVPSLAAVCVRVLARFPDALHDVLDDARHRRVASSPALLDALPVTHHPCLWAALVRLVHPLPPRLHDHDLPLAHPALPLLQRIPDSPDFSLVTLLSLPNRVHLRDHDVARLRTLHRLIALDLRGCPISSSAIVALAHGLVASPRTGTWGLRLLTLHGCPNIDDDVLSALPKFPLLSAVDLRFTRCTPTAVDSRLSGLGFRPSPISSLFHPAPLSVALSALEKIAHTASDPISLYSCSPQSVFRLHIDQLDQPSKPAPVHRPSPSTTGIQTISSAEDVLVITPPLRKRATNDASFSPIPRPSTPLDPSSNVSSFYENAPVRKMHSSILPLSAQAVQSSDPLAIARSPPPWKLVDIQTVRPDRPVARPRQALDSPLKVDRARLHKHGSDPVADMIRRNRLEVQSEFALAKARAAVSAKSRNPFVKSARSVFAESSSGTSDMPPASLQETAPRLRASHSLPSQQRTDNEPAPKPLRPITTFKPPILPKELLPCPPRPRPKLKQARLSFSRQGEVG